MSEIDSKNIIANDLRVGNVIYHKKKMWVVLKTVHIKPGKGGAFIQAEIKAPKENIKVIERFRSTQNIEQVKLYPDNYQYLFQSNDKIILMHQETYEQLSIDIELLGEHKIYLQDNMILKVLSSNNKILFIYVPEYVTLRVIETEAVIKGQTATASYKPALLENNLRITVPPFIKIGDRVIVKTSDNTYSSKGKEE